jgi:Mrp family chromosome partitioning ATPase
MQQLVNRLRARFDYIIIDSPPVLGISDSVSLAGVVDGVILIVETGVTSTDAVAHASRVIRNARGALLGSVLNKVNIRGSTTYRKVPRLYLTT